ncbi:GerAB/ArcD/ProY family transporter [Neobacillus cucumis]|uniref:GerAB/ArcD/ProY family transporter n=1 Tax=Neobacillus cucumis TaxID=1740721 RepID=UPI0028532173|nr:GerAB/ArcD/ProY family transporter [Neobacillus cucumis]MDR4947041.1 GerAB/ArcD/ProY family transporter [Neobacillus cucumis]
MERISVFQLFTLTVCFQIGTTVIFGFASSAGRDAWLSSLISMSIGIIIIVMHTFLMKYNPGLTLVEWFPAQFGRWLGVPLAWLYPLNFLYLGGRTLADMKSLIPATLLPGTPSWFVIAAMLLVIIYCLFSGIEVLARLIEYLLPTLFLFFIIEIVLFFSSGLVHFKNLQPIVGQGWGKVWSAVWPTGISISFAETLTLATIWPLVKKPEKIRKTTILATIVAGLTITVFTLMEITVFGGDILQHTLYPLYMLIRQISLADFLENLDAMVALTMIITAYIKITIYLFAAIRSTQLLMNMRSSASLIFPIAFISYLLCMTMSNNINEHIYSGLINAQKTLSSILLYVVLPSLLLIVTLVRKKWSKQPKEAGKYEEL